jgi:hypothetical protein
MKTRVLLTALLSVAALSASAQKLSGNISPLKDQKEVNFVVDFSGTLVNNASEEKYITDETKRKNDKDKEKWLDEWNTLLRSQVYGVLTKEINDKVSDKFFSVGEYPNAEYTIIVKVKNIETGHYIGISAKASEVKADVNFVKTGETTPFAMIEFKRARNPFGSDMPYFVTRIVMSFGTLGRDTGSAIHKALKK